MKKAGEDMRQFMHALFQSVRGESAAGSDSASGNGSRTASSGNGSSFASGLPALISQVANGSAPADLQSAFNQLTSDLQSAAGGTNSSNGTTTSASTDGSQINLQAFLSKLQAGLGYGASNTPATGNIVSSTA